MTELTQKVERARALVEPDWTPQREQAVMTGLRQRRARRAKLRLAAASVCVTLVVAGGAILGAGWLRARLHPAALSGIEVAGGSVRFPDGSSATPRDAASLLRPVTVTPHEVVVQLASGGASFDVTPDRLRRFRVVAGSVAVEVLGTRFTMVRNDPHVKIEVERGRVLVAFAGGAEELGAGQMGVFPPSGAVAAAAPAAAAPASAASPTAAAPAPSVAAAPVERAAAAPDPPAAKRRAGPSWRVHAQEGDYRGAYEVLSREGAAAVRGTPDDLLLAADVMRLSHHPQRAVAPLRRIISEHGRDPRATLAAFTLGRLLLEELGEPREAAAAFALVQSREPRGPLAEDALAREVEAWSHARVAGKARERALQYVAKYPDGRRTRSVRRYGGLE
jgi:transmembrane sensor